MAKIKPLFVIPRRDYRNAPVIINNFNRLDCLIRQIKWLEDAGMSNIYIVDNASTYPPLLEYYKICPYTVFRLSENVGHTALWDTHLFMWFKDQYYILTDPDIIPVEECPLNAVSYFYEILKRYPDITKVGFGLKIDDLPDHNPRKQEVIDWETKFWENEVEPGLYKSKIDTTFALYRPNVRGQQWDTTLRTGGKYVARHLPWYEDPTQPSEEEVYFKKITTAVSSWYKNSEEKYNG
jgi:Glycosyl transferase family 2.